MTKSALQLVIGWHKRQSLFKCMYRNIFHFQQVKNCFAHACGHTHQAYSVILFKKSQYLRLPGVLMSPIIVTQPPVLTYMEGEGGKGKGLSTQQAVTNVLTLCSTNRFFFHSLSYLTGLFLTSVAPLAWFFSRMGSCGKDLCTGS